MASNAESIHTPYLTLGLLAVLGVVYSFANQSGEDPFALVRYGASVPVLVLNHGQWERLFSANFVHFFLPHYLVNALSLYSLGTLIEAQLGRARFLAIYLGAAVAGAAGSVYMARGPMSVGASTAIFGLLGAFAAMHLRYRDTLDAEVKQTARWWGTILLLNGGLSLLVPQIDASAHVAGFFGGFVMAFLVMPRDLAMPASWFTKLIATVLVAATLVAGWRSVVRSQSEAWTEDVFAAKSAFVSNVNANPVQLNDLAWVTAIDPDSSPRLLELAVTAAEKAVEGTQRNPGVLDTLAQAFHRLGQNARAVALEKEALAFEPLPVFATQLARFLLAENAPASPALTLLTEEGGVKLVARTDTCVQGYLLGYYQGRLAWIVRVFAAADGDLPLAKNVTSRLVPGITTRLVGVSESCEIEPGTDNVRFDFWVREYDVLGLP